MVPFTLEQNGSAERENRFVVDLAKTSLHAEKLPVKMCAEAVNYTIYTLNRTGISGEKGVTNIELWLKKKPKISNLRTFGEEVYFYISKEKRRKWNVKAEKSVFVGYDENTKGFRIWLPERGQVKIHRDVRFTDQYYEFNSNEEWESDSNTIIFKH